MATHTWAHLGAVAVAATAVLAACGQGEEAASQPVLPSALALPVASPVTVTLAAPVGAARPPHTQALLDWVLAETGVQLEVVPVALGSGFVASVELSEMARDGRLPDLVPESMVPNDSEFRRDLFLNVLSHPGLTPELRQLLATDPLFRSGVASRMSTGDELIAVGTYDQSRSPYLGSLLYREDLFAAWRLRYDTWDQFESSLRALKAQFPASHPFRAAQHDIMFELPNWFGTGFDSQLAAYYHPREREWRLGPLENRYLDYVAFLRNLYESGVMWPEDPFMQSDDFRRHRLRSMVANLAFATPWDQATGPAVGAPTPYGELGDDGEWNGEGAWWSPMVLPTDATGQRGWISARPWQPITAGWLVTKGSPRAAEALAVLDLLLGDRAADWVQAAAADGRSPAGAVPLWGRSTSRKSDEPLWRYQRRFEVAAYVDSSGVFTEPWPVLRGESMEVARQMAGAVITVVSAWVIRVVTGELPVEADEMREEVLRFGGQRLMDALATGMEQRQLP